MTLQSPALAEQVTVLAAQSTTDDHASDSTTNTLAPPSGSTPNSVPSGFSRLPEEVLVVIIGYVRAISKFEREDLYKRGRHHIIKLGKAQLEPASNNDAVTLWSHSLQGPPILSTSQSFAAVNKKLHRICTPLLWKTLEFPTRLPLPIEYWTENLLEKYGTHARSLDMQLSEDWFSAAPPRDLNTDLERHNRYVLMLPVPKFRSSEDMSQFLGVFDIDNLWTHLFGCSSKKLSRRSATKITSQCPNIEELYLALSTYDQGQQSSKCRYATYLNRLSALVSGMCGIHHLRIEAALDQCCIKTQEVIQIMKELPLIQSLYCGLFVNHQIDDGRDFGMAISKLKFLTSLTLCKVECFNGSWIGWSYPPQLTNLTISDCMSLPPDLVAWGISTFPGIEKLTHLRLSYVNYCDEDFDDFDIDFDKLDAHSKELFCLPGLLELELYQTEESRLEHFDLLPSFKDCRSIRRLTYNSMSFDSWASLAQLVVVDRTWPLLECLTLRPMLHRPCHESVDDNAKMMLQQYCLQAGINLHINQNYSHM